jgi:lipopolysaccharide biosynthesis glycosyltransferase
VSRLHVSCAAVGDYVQHSAVTLHSVLEQSGVLDVHVHYLHGPGFPAGAADLLTEMVERRGGAIAFHEVAEERVEGLPVVDRFTAAMWFRIFLPELLPDVGRVLYLDADTIAVDSLEPLWATDLDGQWLGAVTNVFQPNHVWRPAELGLAGPEVYFNSGVLLMNLEQMRADGRTEALVRCATERGEALEWPDQDALNLVLGQRRVGLHPRWNCMNSVLSFPGASKVFGRRRVWQARRRPGIRHFEGPSTNKPWNRACDPASRELYARHRGQTPWPDFELEGGGEAAQGRQPI